jgi:hypothetical protein
MKSIYIGKIKNQFSFPGFLVVAKYPFALAI